MCKTPVSENGLQLQERCWSKLTGLGQIGNLKELHYYHDYWLDSMSRMCVEGLKSELGGLFHFMCTQNCFTRAVGQIQHLENRKFSELKSLSPTKICIY